MPNNNMNFGVNLLPVSNKSNSLGSSSKKWDDIYVDKINGQSPTNDALSSAMTYVISGNKSIETVTIPVGAYVRLVGSTITGRSDGIYTVATAIPVDTVIDGTYFNESAPIPGGLGGAVQQSMVKVDKFTVSCAHIEGGAYYYGRTSIATQLSGYQKIVAVVPVFATRNPGIDHIHTVSYQDYTLTDGYFSGGQLSVTSSRSATSTVMVYVYHY